MNNRHYFEPFDNGGALIRPQRMRTGAYDLDPEMKARARAFIEKHADYFHITEQEKDDLFGMLGIAE